MLSQSGIYFVPEVGTLQSFKNYISELPIIDSPEVFGLHENANITYQAQESDKIMMTILSIQPRMSSGAGGKSQDEIVMELAIDLENQLPNLLDRAVSLNFRFNSPYRIARKIFSKQMRKD